MDLFSYIDSLATSSPWILYLLVFISPFVQEDTAVIGTAALTAIGKLSLGPAIVAITAGLFFSDIWKYWIGWLALKNKRGADLSKKDLIISLKDKVESYPMTTLLSARFIPFTRIPTYIACGFFRMSYLKFCVYIAITAALLVAIAFGSFLALGSIMEEKIKWVLPLIGLGIVLIAFCFHFVRIKLSENQHSESK